MSSQPSASVLSAAGHNDLALPGEFRRQRSLRRYPVLKTELGRVLGQHVDCRPLRTIHTPI